MRGYGVEHLGDPGGVPVGDDTGFEKKGTCSAGVQRQYTGTAGKITNCQSGVFPGYAGPRGRALIDRESYLPAASRIADPDRRARAKVPTGVGCATKPQLLAVMIERAIAAQAPSGWVTALTRPPADTHHIQRCSCRRLQHQARARQRHHQQQHTKDH